MTTWHERLDAELTRQGKSWADLVSATGLKKPSVYAWKPDATKRTKNLEGKSLDSVCSYLGVNSGWLLYGDEPKVPSEQSVEHSLEQIGRALAKASQQEKDVILPLVNRYLLNPSEENVLKAAIAQLLNRPSV